VLRATISPTSDFCRHGWNKSQLLKGRFIQYSLGRLLLATQPNVEYVRQRMSIIRIQVVMTTFGEAVLPGMQALLANVRPPRGNCGRCSTVAGYP